MRRPSDRRRYRSPRGFLPGIQPLEDRKLLTNSPPMLLGPVGDHPMTMGQGVQTLTAEAVDPDGDPIRFSLPSAPAGMAIDEQAGVISWDPTAIGTYSAVVQADDGRGGSAAGDFTVTVAVAPVERPVVTVAAVDPVALEATAAPATFSVSRTGPTDRPLAVAFSLGGQATPGVDYHVLGASPDSLPLADTGFEVPEAGPAGAWGSFVYPPAGSAWTYDGGAGVAADGSGFTSGNPPAPEGDQVAFLQMDGTIGQPIDVALAGTYRLSFMAAQRGGGQQGGYHDFAVEVDGTEVGRFRPAGTDYQAMGATFALAVGTHTITFRGLNSAGGDNTSLLDRLRIERVAGTQFLNAGFEAPEAGPAGAWGSFVYPPAGSAWAYAGGAGVAANGSGFTSGNRRQLPAWMNWSAAHATIDIPTLLRGGYKNR